MDESISDHLPTSVVDVQVASTDTETPTILFDTADSYPLSPVGVDKLNEG